MSLLIKALQKAEQGKRSEEKTSTRSNDLALELAPLQSVTRPEDAATDMAPDRFVLEEEPKRASQQAAASTMFKAKSVQPASSGSKRVWLIACAGLILLLGISIGFYSYLESLQQPVPLAIKPAPSIISANAEPQLPDGVNLVASESTPSVLKVAATTPELSEDTQGVQPITPAADNDATSFSNEPAPQTRIAQRARPQQPMVFGAPVEATQANPVKVTRNTPTPAVNPVVLNAYQAFMVGNDAAAQDLYWEALRADVRNVDALLGMAAIAARQGRTNDAAGWYGKVLEVEPRNTIAQAAMISLLGTADPVTSESRIKNLLAQKPDSAYLHAALGNLYAEQNQWPAAQQAYFDAYHFNSDNAEYAFNLAISLDHLGKASLALKYYKEAQALLINTATTNIDRFQLESRIAQLQ
jgi:tetratricopeptide (TPR) repeat protein